MGIGEWILKLLGVLMYIAVMFAAPFLLTQSGEDPVEIIGGVWLCLSCLITLFLGLRLFHNEVHEYSKI